MASLKRGIKYAEGEYQKVGKKIRATGGKVKKAVGDFTFGPKEGYYAGKNVRDTVKSRYHRKHFWRYLRDRGKG
jgi:hypothetical protein